MTTQRKPKLTQRQVDKISNAATDLKIEAEYIVADLNGEYMNSQSTFRLARELKGAPKRLTHEALCLLNRMDADGYALQSICDDIERWCSDWEE